MTEPLWTLDALRNAVEGRVIGVPAPFVLNLSIDSRTAVPGDAFFAIKGDVHDGHTFVAAALERGVAVAVVSEEKLGEVPADGRYVVVDDVLQALERLGRAARVTLHAAQQVAYVAPPAKPGGQDTYGGLLAFTVSTPGTYRIGLSAGAWIDVLRDGIAQTSTAHGHGPACSTLHKIVDFSLQPGGYALQLSGAADPDIGVVIIKAP